MAPKTVNKSAPKAAAKTAGTKAAKTTAPSAAKNATKSPAQTASKPAAKTTSKTVAKSAAKPATKAAAKPAAKAASKTALRGFTAADFDVFTIDGFAPRMEAIKANVRPVLTELGERLAPKLSAMLGEPFYAHVAKHARRTVNPPDDTWVAFSPNPRGYKAHPHFQVGVWQSHVFVWFATIYESDSKAIVAKNLLKNPAVAKALPEDFRWSWDHCRPESATLKELGQAGWKQGLERAIKVQKGEVLCGINLSRTDKRVADGTKLLAAIEEAFEALVPVYRLSV